MGSIIEIDFREDIIKYYLQALK